MFFKSLLKVLSYTYNTLSDNSLDKVDPNIIQYFRAEYGKEWKSALEHHIYKESIKNNKKAA